MKTKLCIISKKRNSVKLANYQLDYNKTYYKSRSHNMLEIKFKILPIQNTEY